MSSRRGTVTNHNIIWVPDTDVSECRSCQCSFHLFRRKHHCRNCGQIFCASCSSKEWPSDSSGSLVRVCDVCFQHLQDRKKGLVSHSDGRGSMGNGEEKVIYETRTYCSKCCILEKRGFKLIAAFVVERNDAVYLKASCAFHGHFETLYCSSVKFFHQIFQFDNDFSPAQKPVKDIEDIVQSLSSSSIEPSNLPLIVELEVYRGSAFMSLSSIESLVRHYQGMYQAESKFILNVKGGSLRDLDQLNELNSIVLHVESIAKGCLILLDLSFERLIDLARLSNSALLKGRVFPAVRYCLTPGQESLCIEELTRLLKDLADFNHIKLALFISLERPFPALQTLLEFIFQNKKMINFLVISRERSPRGLYSKLTSDERAPAQASVDPVELIDILCKSSRGLMQQNDFLPLSVMESMRPFLEALGYGSYNLSASAFCGFVTCLIETEAQTQTPLTRLIDVVKLYMKLPLSTESPNSIISSHRLKRLLESCALPPLSSSQKSLSALVESGATMQFIIIHNTMDFASLDIRRRCKCAVLTSSSVSSGGVAASCSGGCF